MRCVESLEQAVEILEAEYQKVEALKAEVGAMATVKTTEGATTEIKGSWTQPSNILNKKRENTFLIHAVDR